MTLSRRTFLLSAAVLGVACAIMPSGAIAAAANLGADGVAISGYDPVAYFAAGAATKGDSALSATHEGATYHFSSAKNRDTFLANPAKYAPAYGGYCAYAVANGYTAKIDPEAFIVVDDTLYLNYSKGVRTRWSKDVAANISKGNANWPALSQK